MLLKQPPPRHIYEVSELAETLRALIEDALPSVWIQGEISNLSRPASGHWYFTIKDAKSQLRCAMFRNQNYLVRPVPNNGDLVMLRARAGVYPARGELQLIVEHMEPAGTGNLLLAFEQLKARLSAEGLFDADKRRPIPPVPRRIGVITSATGAAVQDVMTALSRRWPLAPVTLWPVPVQGAEAAPAICRALAGLPEREAVDVILLVRGGGSIEDLWAFNEEAVARAVRACAVPVIVGVGHETDFTIADFAADLRAPTPTAAAELATPDQRAFAQRLQILSGDLAGLMKRRLQQERLALMTTVARLQRQAPQRRLQDGDQRIDELGMRLASRATQTLALARLRLLQLENRRRKPELKPLAQRHSELRARLERAATQRIARHQDELSRMTQVLQSLNPQAVLDRGYAVARDAQGRIVRRQAQLAVDEAFSLQLADGAIDARRI